MTTQRTQIVDVNGKHTTVHRRVEGTVKNKRLSVGSPPKTLAELDTEVSASLSGATYSDSNTYTTEKGVDYNVDSRPGAVGGDHFTLYVEGFPPETVQMHENGYFMARGERMGKTLDEVANNIAWV